MPVAKGPAITVRSVALVGASALFIVGLVAALLWLAFSQGNTTVVLGDRDFDAGKAVSQSQAIRQDGPILYPDLLSGGQRDIYLTHQGNDPEVGWYAFAVRRDSDPKECYFQWDSQQNMFHLTNVLGSNGTCESVSVDAVGAGLTQYPVEIRDGNVHILLYQSAVG